MTSTVKTVRLRAGFYVTRDAQFRIVRRRFLAGAVTHWHVEHWNEATRRFEHLASFHTLAKARAYVGMCQFAVNGPNQP